MLMEVIYAFAILKKAAAMANMELGLLAGRIGTAMPGEFSAQRVYAGHHT